MEALYISMQATTPALNALAASRGELKPALHSLSCTARRGTFPSRRKSYEGKKRRQVCRLEFRHKAAANVEDSISNKANKTDRLRKAVTGVHPNNINGFLVVDGDAVAREAAKEGATKEANGASMSNYNGTISQAKGIVTMTKSSGNGGIGFSNGISLRASESGNSSKGHVVNGVAAQSPSANGSTNAATVYGEEKGSMISEKSEVPASGSALNGVSLNKVVKGSSRVSSTNGSATLLPKLERDAEVPFRVSSAPSDNGSAVKSGCGTVAPLSFARTRTTPSTLVSPFVTDQNDQRVAEVSHQEKNSGPPSGLGILKFLKGKHILVTGATGFLAKVMVEKILRAQPDVGQLYLLIQPQKKISADERLRKTVINSQLFKVIKSVHGEQYEEFMRMKLTAVSGTISTDGFGMDSDSAGDLSKKLEIIVNSAATTTFDERFDIALNVNTQGPGRLLEFAKRCPNLQLFLHVSTAFVNGHRQGRTSEKPLRMGDSIAKEMDRNQTVPELSVQAELELSAKTLREVEAEVALSSLSSKEQKKIVDKKMMDLGMTRAQLFGWQDTYVFSKALGEMLLNSQSENIPMVVLRPSVVESTAQEPFPGWMEGIRMMDPVMLAYGKGQMTGFLANPEGVLDVIPADMVVNVLLAAMTKHAQKPGFQVYQVASSVVNPLTNRILADCALEHFTKDPILDKAGNPIEVKPLRLVESMLAFSMYMWYKYELPLQLSKFLPWMANGKLSAKQILILHKTLEQFKYLANIYKPYTFYLGRFAIDNTESLAKELSTKEFETFGFNVHSIDWADYLCNVHIPGLRQYVMKGRV